MEFHDYFQTFKWSFYLNLFTHTENYLYNSKMCKHTYNDIQVTWCTMTMTGEILDIPDLCQAHVKISKWEMLTKM